MAIQPIRLALDQNFPLPILRSISGYLKDIEFVPIRDIDPRMATLDDRQLILALQQLGWVGHQFRRLASNDATVLPPRRARSTHRERPFGDV